MYICCNRRSNGQLIDLDPWIADDATRVDVNGKGRGEELTLTSVYQRAARYKSEPPG
jgi:hypothetical protein